ncbi:hypothetical protein [Kribbella sp. NPDC048928]|uniref:hypothetical protein n=1 Tax=Kribbella sp. NPDC048928 TaxID=3364111 RepID=UPI00371FA867
MTAEEPASPDHTPESVDAYMGFFDRPIADYVLRQQTHYIVHEPEFAGALNRQIPYAAMASSAADVASRSQTARTEAYAAVSCALAFYAAAAYTLYRESSALLAWRNPGLGESLQSVGQFDAALERLGGSAPAALIAVANVALIISTIRVSRWMRGRLREWCAQVRSVLRPALRVAVNRELSEESPHLLHISDAQGLAHIDGLDRWVERASSTRIARLISDLGASAIAVSGRRGVGKTSLLRRMASQVPRPAATDADSDLFRDNSKPLRVFVDAPVDYAPRDFLLNLYSQLCEAVIQTAPGPRFHPRTVAGRFIVRRVALAVRLACGLLITALLASKFYPLNRPAWLIGNARLVLDFAHINHAQATEPTVIYAIGIVAIYVAAGYFRWPVSGDLAKQATRELAQLRYLQTLQSEHAANLTRSVLGLSWRRARQLAEQPMAMPELVRRYRTFAEKASWEYGNDNGPGLIVAIDEMDRIANAQSAEDFLNQIKAIFGVPRCVYLVAVSDEALSQFERRISTLRTTIDTTFDEVVWLPEFTLVESVTLLRRRATGFPDLFLALCHCLSGGVPRDLVRAARSLVDTRRGTGLEELSDITTAVINSEVAGYLRGLIRHLHQAPQTDLQGQPGPASHTAPGAQQPELIALLLRLNEDPLRWRGYSTQLTDFVNQGNRPATELTAVVEYYAVVEDLFTSHRHIVDAAVRVHPCEHSLQLLERIATCRATLPLSPSTTIRQLKSAQARFHSRRHAAPQAQP